MKLKRIVLVGLVVLMTGVGALNAQVSLIDQFSLGMSLGLSEARGDPPVGDGMFDNCHFIMDYWLGAFIPDADSAIYAGLRWDLGLLDIGGMWDYYFSRTAGLSLGAGAEVADMNLFSTYGVEEPAHKMVPYVRVGLFMHELAFMKMGVDYTYKTNGQQRLGFYFSLNVLSGDEMDSRWRSSSAGSSSASAATRPPSTTTSPPSAPAARPDTSTSGSSILDNYNVVTDTRLVGRWLLGNRTSRGIELRFNSDHSMTALSYENGKAETLRRGDWLILEDKEEYEDTYLIFVVSTNDTVFWAFYFRNDNTISILFSEDSEISVFNRVE